jgi:hypothetical protein
MKKCDALYLMSGKETRVSEKEARHFPGADKNQIAEIFRSLEEIIKE